MRRSPFVAAALLVVATLAVGAAAVDSGTSTAGAAVVVTPPIALTAAAHPKARPLPTATLAPTPAAVVVPKITRDQLYARARQMTGTHRRIDRLEAKLVTWDEFHHAHADQEARRLKPPGTVVWALAVGGAAKTFHGDDATWMVYLIDAATGEPMAAYSGVIDPWPPYFDRLPDRLSAH